MSLNDIIRDAKNQGLLEQKYKCQFCNKGFMRESSLAAHLCETKRRHQQKDEIGVRLGFQAWLRFYELTQGSAKLKNYDDFVDSPFYTAFIKFGRHLHSIRAIKPQAFIDWVIKNNKKLDQWCRDSFYEEYLKEYLFRENVQDALERAISEIGEWAAENASEINHFFLYVSENRLTSMIVNGRISPWVIYCCDSGIESLARLNQEQIAMIYSYINPEIWQKKLKDYPADAEWAKYILKQSGF